MTQNHEILGSLIDKNPELFGQNGLFGGVGQDHIFLQRLLRYLESTDLSQVSTENFIKYLEKRSDLSKEKIAEIKEKLQKNGDALPQFAQTLDNLGISANPEQASRLYDAALIESESDDRHKKQREALALAALTVQGKRNEAQEMPAPELLSPESYLPDTAGVQLKLSRKLPVLPKNRRLVSTLPQSKLRKSAKPSKVKRISKKQLNAKMNSKDQEFESPVQSRIRPKQPKKSTSTGTLSRIVKYVSIGGGIGLGGLLTTVKPAATQTATSILDLLLK